MSVRNGREFLAIPGPTTVPDAVLNAMHRAAIEIYSGELVGITDACLARLKTVFRTAGNAYIYAANGHGAWEAAVTNVLSRGDTILVLQSGALVESGTHQSLLAAGGVYRALFESQFGVADRHYDAAGN